jgi:hypothetical protein
VDGQPNGRLGREEQWHQFEYRRQILRCASPYTYPNSNSNSEPNADTDANGEPYTNTDSDRHGNSYSYTNPGSYHRH